MICDDADGVTCNPSVTWRLPVSTFLLQWAPHQIQIAASCDEGADAGDDDAGIDADDDDDDDNGVSDAGAGVHDEDALYLLSQWGPHSIQIIIRFAITAAN